MWCEEAGHEVSVRLLHRLRGPRRRSCRPTSTSSSSAPSPPPRTPPRPSATSTGSAASSRCWAGRTRAATRRTRHAISTTCSASPTARWSREVLARLRAASARGPAPRRQEAAAAASRRQGAVEVHRADDRQGADGQDRADDRQPRLPVHLQLLHRRRRSTTSRSPRPDPGRPALPARQAEAAARRLARPELRRALRRDHGGDRGGGARRPHRLRRREQPVAPFRAAPEAAGEERLQGASSPASSRGTRWATSRRPAGTPASKRCGRSPTTST